MYKILLFWCVTPNQLAKSHRRSFESLVERHQSRGRNSAYLKIPRNDAANTSSLVRMVCEPTYTIYFKFDIYIRTPAHKDVDSCSDYTAGSKL